MPGALKIYNNFILGRESGIISILYLNCVKIDNI